MHVWISSGAYRIAGLRRSKRRCACKGKHDKHSFRGVLSDLLSLWQRLEKTFKNRERGRARTYDPLLRRNTLYRIQFAFAENVSAQVLKVSSSVVTCVDSRLTHSEIKNPSRRGPKVFFKPFPTRRVFPVEGINCEEFTGRQKLLRHPTKVKHNLILWRTLP